MPNLDFDLGIERVKSSLCGNEIAIAVYWINRLSGKDTAVACILETSPALSKD